MSYWLVKSEPEEYSFVDLEREGVGVWDGVRNPQAQRYLKEMRVGELVLYYHTGREKAIVGLAEVVREAFPDPTDPRYVAVELRAVRRFPTPLKLEAIRRLLGMEGFALLRQPRLSVMPVPEQVWQRLEENLDWN